MFCQDGEIVICGKRSLDVYMGDGVLLSVVDSELLTGFIIVNSLLGHESVCKEFTKFGGVLSDGTSLLVKSFYSLKRSP